jgi:hypothetical protein
LQELQQILANQSKGYGKVFRNKLQHICNIVAAAAVAITNRRQTAYLNLVQRPPGVLGIDQVFDPGSRPKDGFRPVSRPLTIDLSPRSRRRSWVVVVAIKDNAGCSNRQQSNNRLLFIRKHSFLMPFSRAGVKKSIGAWACRFRQPTAQPWLNKLLNKIKSDR